MSFGRQEENVQRSTSEVPACTTPWPIERPSAGTGDSEKNRCRRAGEPGNNHPDFEAAEIHLAYEQRVLRGGQRPEKEEDRGPGEERSHRRLPEKIGNKRRDANAQSMRDGPGSCVRPKGRRTILFSQHGGAG